MTVHRSNRRGQSDDLIAMIVKQSVSGDHECAGAHFHQGQESRIEVALAARLQDVEL
jgi:hypothetical protein